MFALWLTLLGLPLLLQGSELLPSRAYQKEYAPPPDLWGDQQGAYQRTETDDCDADLLDISPQSLFVSSKLLRGRHWRVASGECHG